MAIMTRELTIDEKIQRDVLDELHWDTVVKATDVGVEVDDGIVTLSGAVNTYHKRRSAADAALRVYGVRGLVNKIEVPTLPHRHSDTDIARMAAQRLEWDTTIPEGRVMVRVDNGWITLDGTVDYHHQMWSAEEAVERLPGVRGVTNLIEVKPLEKAPVSALELKDQIEKAFTRNAEIDARRIVVNVDGTTVTLTGNVRSWAELRQASRAAWSMPGVQTVKDQLEVVP